MAEAAEHRRRSLRATAERELETVLPRLLPPRGIPQRDEGEWSDLLALLDELQKSRRSPTRPALLYYTDLRIHDTLTTHPLDDPEMPSLLKKLQRYGLAFARRPRTGEWVYGQTLLRNLWRDHPKSRWGEEAFLDLLRAGWDTSGICRGGADQFRKVTQAGESFLSSHPTSPLRTAVLWEVALAYETQWSLGKATGDRYVDGRRYAPEGPTARRRAIAAYEKILATDPESLAAEEARIKLHHLSRDLDTVSRTHYCVND